MNDNIRRLVDMDDQTLAHVPFGRNRFLRALGIMLFGFATRLAAPQLARAYHGSTPYPCFGLRECHCCSGTNCCTTSNCGGNDCQYPYHLSCPGGGQCWYTCSGTELFQCCDWQEQIRIDPSYCAWKSCVCVKSFGTVPACY